MKIKIVLILTVFVLFCLHLSSCKQCDKEKDKTKIQSNVEDVMKNTTTVAPTTSSGANPSSDSNVTTTSSDANPSSDPNVAPVATTPTSAPKS